LPFNHYTLPKFLIVRFSSIGDIVLTTPIIRCIKQQVSDAEVHYLTRSPFKEVLSGNPYIDKLFILENKLSSILPLLKNEKYDAIIDLHHNQRSWLVKLNLKSPGYSFHKLNIEKWLMVNFKLNRLPKRHIVDRYFDVVKRFGVKYDGGGLDFFIQAEAKRILEKLPETHQQKFLAFVIGAKHATKRLPVDKIINLCNKIQTPIILLGGHEDEQKGCDIASAVGSKVFSACGKTTLHESAALIEAAEYIISHDTGMMHIAAGLQKKIISVWGNTIPEFGMYPFYNDENGGSNKGLSTIVEVKNLSCRPCSKIGFDKCPKGHFDCMNKIDEKEILRRISD